MILPSGRLYWALAASALVVAWSPIAGWSGCASLLLLWWIDGWSSGRGPGLEFRVTAPRTLGLGQSDGLEVEVQNRSDRALRFQLAADLPFALAGPDASDSRLLTLASRARTSIRFSIVAGRRGVHDVGALYYRVLGPLGLAWREASEPVEREVMVVPGLKEARDKRLRAWRHYLRRPGNRTVRLRGDSGAFESMREYVRGDDPRRIDWKATARRSKTMVRRYEAERSQSLILCIDAGRLMAEHIGDRQRLDHALSAAVVLADVARAWSDNVGVFVFSDHVQAVLPPGQYPPDRIPAMLATVEARAVEPDYPRALVTLSRLVTRRSLLVLFSDVIDRAVSGALTAHVGQLARRHLPLFVAIRDPALQRAGLAGVAETTQAYHRAAANELVLARAKTLESMRRSGIQVVDVAPTSAIEAVVNQYLEIKQRGAL